GTSSTAPGSRRARACCASRPAATPPTPPSSPATAPASGWARRPSPRPSTATSPPTTTPRPCRSPDGGARPGHYADPGPLAQSVEQRTFNPWVVGSSPTGPTVERRRPARPPAAQRVRVHSHTLPDPDHRRVQRQLRIFLPGLGNKPHRTLTKLRRILPRCWHSHHPLGESDPPRDPGRFNRRGRAGWSDRP